MQILLNALSVIIFFIISIDPAFAIYRGSQVNPRSESFVYRIKMEQNNEVAQPCSATIISDHALLTAAHCVDRLDLDQNIYLHLMNKRLRVESIYIPLGYYDAVELYKSSVSLEDIVKYNRETAKYDIAIINLKFVLPINYNKVDLSFTPQERGLDVLVIGYGYTLYNEQTGTFYHKPTLAHRREISLDILENGVYIVKGSSFDDFVTTPGDSGGPLFIGSSNIQIGVLRGSSATEFESASIYTPLYLHQDFILRYVK